MSKQGRFRPRRTADKEASLTHARGVGRGRRIMRAYKKAFGGFSDEEMLLLDGIVLDLPGERR